MRAASKSREVSKILVRCALWFCACNVLAAALAAQCTSPTQVSNGTYTSGDHSATDNNALSAANFVIGGSATATFVAGNCIQLLPGFHASAIGATVPTTFHAWVETAPAAVSVAPTSGSGLTQPFTWTFSSPSGTGNISSMQLLFNTSVSGPNACWIYYSVGSNLLYLSDNNGSTWLGGIVAGQSGTVSNSQCSISGSGAAATASGNQLALTVPVTFQSSFSGAKNDYAIAYDNEGLNTTWVQMGTWTVSNPSGFTPIRISSGGAYTDSLGQVWSADYGYLQGSTYSTSAAITGTSDQRLYQTERWNQPSLTYQFSVPNGNYTVTLKFAEIYDTAPGQRYMNATLNGTTVFTNLDVWTATGGPNRAYDVSYPVSVTNGLLTITLTCTSPNNSAEVNSIQIVAAGTGSVATPSFSPAPGSYSGAQTVTLSSTTGGASIRYTTNGTTPTETVGTLYTGGFTVSTTTTVKAIAYLAGWADSLVASGTYTIAAPTVATPTFSPVGGSYSGAQSVTITTTTPNATIRYTTDGSTPTESAGTIYSGAITVSSTETLKAIAYEAGWTDSTVSSATYTITGAAATPTFSPAGGNYTSGQSVTITTTTPSATIRYTTNGDTPSRTTGTLYTGPVSIGATTTLKAIAYATGLSDSAVFTAAYTISVTAGTPTISPATGTYTSPTAITLSSTTPGASIRYTTNGSTPTETVGTLYSSPFTLSSPATVKAIAYATGWIDSSIGSAIFTFAAAPPSFQPPTGTYAPGQTVVLSTTTPGASIRFTTDGSTPSETVGSFYTSPVTVTNGMIVRAIAYITGWTDSAITSETYTVQSASSGAIRDYIHLGGRVLAIENGASQTVSSPGFSPGGGTYTTAQSITITTTTPGATIRYTTDGSTPSETAGTIYGGPVPVASSMTIRAIAYETGWTDSAISSATYTITGSVSAPAFNPGGGNYTAAQSVAITTTTPGATIRYTTDGSTPSETAGTIYGGPVYVASSMTVRAIAYEAGWTDSTISSANYTITGTVAAPTLNPGPGTYASPQTVSIGTGTPGASIRYTTDGSTPTPTYGTLYAGAFTISSTESLKAIAYETGWANSSVTTGAYTITPETVSTPNQPNGTASGTLGTSYTYTTGGSVSSYGSGVQYQFTWGDGNSGWLAPGTTSASHVWSSAGTYTVTVQARSAVNALVLSSPSPGLSVTMTDPVPVPWEFIPSGTGTTQQFTIQVVDYAGTSAITYVQPFLANSSNSQGQLTDLSNSCHLEYQASGQTLSLDSSSGNNSWVGHGTQNGIGAWVDSNTNNVCQVNSWSIQPSGNTLVLNVSLTFQTPGTWYQFLSASNGTGDSAWVTNGFTWTAQ